MIRSTLKAVPAALASTLLAACSIIPSVAVTPRYGQLTPSGHVAAADSGVGISGSADVEELGLDTDTVFQPRIDFGWGPLDVVGTYDAASYSGNGEAGADLDLGGTVITAGTPVSSDLDVTTINLIATFDFIPTDLVDVGIGVGARSIDFDARIASATDTIESAESFVMPVAAARAAVALGDFRVVAIGSGLTGEYDGIEGTILDLDFMASYQFDFVGFYWGIVGGYRYMKSDIEYEDDGSDVEADLTFDGPYFGLTIGL